MDEYEFENFVGRVLDALGFRDTVVVGRPGDGGVDVKCSLRNALVEASVAVQVKRQQGNVGPKEISYLRDRWSRKVDKLLFVTTSDHTAGAREVAEDDGLKPVILVTGHELASLMIRERIGISSQVVERFVIDDEFFAG
jgi:restriction system protein